MDVNALNALPPEALAATLERCCGARAWVRHMLRAVPFADEAAVAAAADRAFAALTEGDWLEAFAHHPRIGDVSRLRERFKASGVLSEKEQGGAMAGAEEAVIQRLFALNQAYEARHGHIFIVCASGKSAAEMLALLEARIEREPPAELATCAAEQAKITHLRLGAL
jgi:2-oxo-4-hydroxy-4-carboxy-5-ureidoimidazoline decarboxylase